MKTYTSIVTPDPADGGVNVSIPRKGERVLIKARFRMVSLPGVMMKGEIDALPLEGVVVDVQGSGRDPKGRPQFVHFRVRQDDGVEVERELAFVPDDLARVHLVTEVPEEP